MTLAAYLHRLDPYAIKLWEGGPIRWYGLSYLAGFLVGYLLIKRIVRIGKSPLDVQQTFDLIFRVAVGVMVGGRLGYAVFYDPQLFITFSNRLPFWNLLALNRGGMASHGGLIGLVFASLWFARGNKVSFLHILDLTAFAGPLGLFLGRVANFVNGELYGRKCAEDFPLAVKFPQELPHLPGVPELDAKLRQLMPTHVPWEMAFDWTIRKIQEGNEQVIRIVEPLLPARHPSQLYAAVLEGLVVFAVLAAVWARPRKPGVIFGVCCVVYSVVRIFGELFRQPDEHIAHLEAAQWGITRGQWLSALLLIAGVLTWAVCARRNVERLGGWSRGDTHPSPS